MRTALLLTVYCSASFALAADDAHFGKSQTEVAVQLQQLQKRYAERLYQEVLPRLGNMPKGSPDNLIFSPAHRLWKEVFGSHEQLLRSAAREILADLSEARPIDETEYSVVSEGRGFTGGLVDLDNDALRKLESMAQMMFWNPVVAASHPCRLLFVRELGSSGAANRQLIETVVPPIWQAIDRNPEHPKLIRRMGPEVVIVELEFKHDSFYYPVRTRWLRLKNGANGTRKKAG